MKDSSVKSLAGFASIRITVDLFLGPAMFTLALLFSLLVPVPAHAQFSGAAQTDFAYQRTMSRIAGGSAAGLQLSSNSTMNIMNGGRVLGTIALKEKRLMDIATLGARAASLPGMVAIGATLLLQYGLEKCADGTWCKRGGQPGSSANLQCKDLAKFAESYGYYQYGGNKLWGWYIATNQSPGNVTPPGGYGASQGYFRADGICDPNNGGYNIFFFPQVVQNPPPSQLVPATATDILEAWKNGLKGNPYVQEQMWGFEDQTQKNADWEAALAQTAELIGSGAVTDVGPEISTTADGKTTKKQTTCTYTATPNADTSTSKTSPLNVGRTCTTTTTNPDGTKTQETTTETSTPAKDQAAQKVEVETCGLPNKPACKIDESGTATEADGKAKVTAATADLTAARVDAVQKMNDAAKQTEFGLHLPQFLPGGSCQPITFFHWKDRDGTVDLCDKLGFIRTLLSWLWPSLAAIYIYNKVASANA